MIKISRVDAYQAMDESDFKAMDQELNELFGSDQRNGREMTHQFFLEDKNTIALVVYWDKEEVETIRFNNKGKLTEEGKRAVGRPSLGTTKKVSLTLPDEIWEFIDKRKETWGVSQSKTLRKFIEDYYYQK